MCIRDRLPTYLNKVYLYTATWGLPGCIELEIKDNAVIFDMSAKSNPKDVYKRQIHSHGIKNVRVLDRTFNYNPRRAKELLQLFLEFNPDICFHLEIHN